MRQTSSHANASAAGEAVETGEPLVHDGKAARLRLAAERLVAGLRARGEGAREERRWSA